MPKFIVIFGEEPKAQAEAEGRINASWCPRSLKTSDSRIMVLEAEGTAQDVSLRLFPDEHRSQHLVFRVSVGSYYGYHDGELWDFLVQ